MHTGLSVFQACYDAIKHQSFVDAYEDTFDVVLADTDELKDKLFQLRYTVFCEENNCDEASHYPDKKLKEPYDAWATHFLLIHKESGDVAGGVSVVLPNREKPLQGFPVQEMCDHPLVHMEGEVYRLCEISRLFMAPRFRRRPEDGRLMPRYYDQDWGLKFTNGKIDYFRRRIPYAPLGLLRAVFEQALDHRIMDCVVTVESAHLQSLQDIGLSYRVLGPRIKGPVPRQPVIFNIKIALDHMREQNRHCYELVSDQGRLAKVADEVNKHTWMDDMFSKECWDHIYNKFL
jgi:N-acyl amino acid synthase of PEP-CTERM/exosortase system